jgi:hypothetical protein
MSDAGQYTEGPPRYYQPVLCPLSPQVDLTQIRYVEISEQEACRKLDMVAAWLERQKETA